MPRAPPLNSGFCHKKAANPEPRQPDSTSKTGDKTEQQRKDGRKRRLFGLFESQTAHPPANNTRANNIAEQFAPRKTLGPTQTGLMQDAFFESTEQTANDIPAFFAAQFNIALPIDANNTIIVNAQGGEFVRMQFVIANNDLECSTGHFNKFHGVVPSVFCISSGVLRHFRSTDTFYSTI
jgi:hypothetical protein